MAFNNTSTVTLLVNGEQAESALDAMRKKADELSKSLQQAQLAGDKVTMRRLQKELEQLMGKIDDVEDSMNGVDKVMQQMSEDGKKVNGITVIFNKLGQAVKMKMPDWFGEKFPDFEKYFAGLTSVDYAAIYGQLMELRETFKDGTGTIKMNLANGKTIELSSLDDIKGMMERLLRMIETDKQLKARWEDEQNPKRGRKSYKYTQEDEWKRAKDSENFVAMSTGQKDYQQYLLDRTRIEEDYLRKKIVNWRSTDTEIQQFERQLATLQQKEQTQLNKQQRLEETKINREKREEITETHQKRLEELEEMNQSGKLSYRAYKEAVLREDVEYLQQVKEYYKKGSIYRYYVEREINAKIKQEREQKARELQEAETALRQKYYKVQEIRNREDIEHEYEVRKKALTIMYQNMIEQANGNVKEIEKITKQYHRVVRKEEIAMKKALGEEVTLTWQEKIEAFYEWLQGDEGRKWHTIVNDMAASMGAIFSSVTEMAKIESEIAIAHIEKRYEREISMAEGNQYKVKMLERAQAKEIAKQKKNTAEKTFALQVLSAVATTAENAVKAYGDALSIGGPAGLIMAPIAAAMAVAAGMVQIALINKQKSAAASISYAQGGFTKKGRENEVAGIVHAGEWVASRKLVQNPVVYPLLQALDHAQKTNVIGTSKLLGAEFPGQETKAAEPQGMGAAMTQTLVEGITRQDLALTEMSLVIEQNVAMQKKLRESLEKLSQHLEVPSQAVVSITGDEGLERAQTTYQRLLNNKTPKSKRK